MCKSEIFERGEEDLGSIKHTEAETDLRHKQDKQVNL